MESYFYLNFILLKDSYYNYLKTLEKWARKKDTCLGGKFHKR